MAFLPDSHWTSPPNSTTARGAGENEASARHPRSVNRAESRIAPVRVVVVIAKAGRIEALRDREALVREVPPRHRGQPRAADRVPYLVLADVRIALVERRSAQQHRERQLVARRHVVGGSALRIDEAEGETCVGIDPLDDIVEIAAPDRGQPRPFAARDRPFTKKRPRSFRSGPRVHGIRPGCPRASRDSPRHPSGGRCAADSSREAATRCRASRC